MTALAAALRLNLNEATLLAAQVGGDDREGVPLHITRLSAPWPTLMRDLPALGEVTAQTGNAACVHEAVGTYTPLGASGDMGFAVGPTTDLRLFYSAWAHGFAVREHTADGPQHSLQWFDAAGAAVHKVHVREAGRVAAYRALVRRHTHADQSPAALTLRDVQGGFHLDRLTALRAAGDDYAREIDAASACELLHRAAQDGTPIKVFTGNRGLVQIHTGPVQHVTVKGPWVSVRDRGFCLHLLETGIASAWRVRKPTADGLVSSLELFDPNGEPIAQFFDARKPGQPERAIWRELLASVAWETLPCAA